MKKIYSMILMSAAALTASAADWTYAPMVREGGTDVGEFYLRFDGTATVPDHAYSVLYRYDSPEFDKANAQIAAYMREDGYDGLHDMQAAA